MLIIKSKGSLCGKLQPPLMDVDTKYNDTLLHTGYEESSSGQLVVTIIPTLLASSTVLVVILIFCFLHKQRRQQRVSALFINEQQGVTVDTPSVCPPGVPAALSDWEIPKECVLGGVEFWQTGHYGPICKGLLTDKRGSSSAVVVKCLRDGYNLPESQHFLQCLLFQATVCKHDNVVQMLFCQTKRTPMYLVLVCYEPGNLLHFLWTLRKSSATGGEEDFCERSMFLLARQVAIGLDYLMSEHRLVHGDVAARNILIGPGLSARVSGLGGAFERRQNNSEQSARRAELPLKWQAPEKLMMQLSIDRSDVWSFGILLYEMITLGAPPYPELEPLLVLPKLQASYRMKRPNDCGGPLYNLMNYCWMWSFKDRPAFSSIIKLLDSSLHLAYTEPICIPEAIDVFEYSTMAGLVS